MYLYEFSQNRYLCKIQSLIAISVVSLIFINVTLIMNSSFVYYPLYNLQRDANTTMNNINSTLIMVNNVVSEIQIILPLIVNATIQIKTVIEKICESYVLCESLGAADLCGGKC